MKKILARLALASMMLTVAPKPALADGAASTRNIILGGAALYWLVSANNEHQRALRQRRSYAQQRRYTGYPNQYNGYSNQYNGYRETDDRANGQRYHSRRHRGHGHGEGHGD